MKKWLLVSVFLTIPHILEDVGLFVLGRYTETSLWVVGLLIAGVGLGAGAIVRIHAVRRFLGR